MMPMLRIRSSGTVRGIKSNPSYSRYCLPPVVREGFVGLGHAVDIVLFLDGAAAQIRGVVDLIRELIGHALLGPGASVDDDPAERETGPAILRNLHRNLVVRAANPPRLHFEQRLGVLDGLLEDLERIVTRALSQGVHRRVEQLL